MYKLTEQSVTEAQRDFTKNLKMIASIACILNAPMVAKQAIAQGRYTYLLLYNLAYEVLTPAQKMRIWTTLRQMTLSQEKMLRELAQMLAKLEGSLPGSKPREPEWKFLTEEGRRRLDAVIAIFEASRKESEGTAGESTKDGEPSRS